jgi:hypothetical protein
MSEENVNSVENKKIDKKIRRRLIIESRIAVLNILLVSVIIVGGFGYLLFFKRDTISKEENRKLATFPKFTLESYFNGEYTEAIANYYDDTVPNRSFFKNKVAFLRSLKGRSYGDGDYNIVFYGPGVEIEDEPVVTTITTTSTTADTNITQTTVSENATTIATTTTTTVPDNFNPPVDNGMISNNIVVVNNRGIMLYGGGKKNGQEYANSLNEYKKALGEGVNVYSMVCPTSVSYYMPENYAHLTASEEDNINNINSFLTDVKPVDVFTALLYHKKENIYARTDHHWLPLGAYYAAEEFAKVAGVDFAELNEQNYDTLTLNGYVGTLYGYTQNADLLNNPEDFIYYSPKAECKTTRYNTSFTNGTSGSLLYDGSKMKKSNYYMVFGGDEQITHIETSTKNGRNLVIFKDSYGNALAPVLTYSFENIYVCDIRYFNLNAISFIQNVNATDVLFAMNTYSATGQNHDYIEYNRTK